MRRNKRIQEVQKFTITISIIALVLSVIALIIAANKPGYDEGFNACIEENNLYERYEINGKK